MIQFPNCKINLGLSITRKREDGYHELNTVFYPIGFQDALEFVECDEMKFDQSGITIPGPTNNNIILKAYQLLKKEYPKIRPLHIYLLKHIPTGGGLGGGSSNGAFMLMMMNEFFNLHLSTEQLLLYALQLGSDCPFFIYNTPCFASGRGDMLEPLPLDLSAYYFVLVFPGIHIDTSFAFHGLIPSKPKHSIKNLISQAPETWKDVLINDFEISIFKQHPVLQQIKESLYEMGVTYASMSGSGSTIFGMIKKDHYNEVKKLISANTFFQTMQIRFA